MLADDRSRQVFDATLDRLLDSATEPGVMRTVCERDQYFPPGVMPLSEHESFVDAGAYTGDTVSDFLRRTGGRFDAIHAFELDAVNFRGLQATAAAAPGAERIFLHPEGIYDAPAEITYSVGKSQSTIGAGTAQGRVVRLDDAIGGTRVTFLKMDIEGAEPKALEGARATILANKPKLAICTYHHIKDLWEIPLYVTSLVPEYRIYLRHHTKLEYETVCYAIPPAT
jgi:FkbM family methyltransferase